jgi:hypothetical protein
VPCVARWPGRIKAGLKTDKIMSHEDWIPTLLAAAGRPGIVDKLKKGYRANGKKWKVHLDGYDFMPLVSGKTQKGPREQIFYFSQAGELNAVRWNDWKVHFAQIEGNIATGTRTTPGWPLVINLKADPYETMWNESSMYIRWYADNMWLFVPVQAQVQTFLASLEGYPFQSGSSLGADGINYRSLKAMKILEQLKSSSFPVNR